MVYGIDTRELEVRGNQSLMQALFAHSSLESTISRREGQVFGRRAAYLLPSWPAVLFQVRLPNGGNALLFVGPLYKPIACQKNFDASAPLSYICH